MQLHREVNVEYSPFETLGMTHYRYHWRHLDTNTNGDTSVWCWKHDDFLKLLGHWNRTEYWHYYEINSQVQNQGTAQG